MYGRRGSTYYKYRNRDIAATWEGDTDQPGVEIAETISNTLMDAYMKPAEKGGVSELYIVYTEFINMVVQKVRVLRMLPVEIVKNETKVPDPDEEAPATADVAPLYTFEPSLEKVLDAILPKYIQSRIHECLLTAAASDGPAFVTTTVYVIAVRRNYPREKRATLAEVVQDEPEAAGEVQASPVAQEEES